MMKNDSENCGLPWVMFVDASVLYSSPSDQVANGRKLNAVDDNAR